MRRASVSASDRERKPTGCHEGVLAVNVVVVGGANTDVVGATQVRFASCDSNPGHVTISAGGVGRNVAENLARLGSAVAFVTAFGDDDNGNARRAECQAAGIDVSRTVSTPGVPGPVYLAVLDEQGDMRAAVSDMRALEAMGALDVTAALTDLPAVAALVLDANPAPDVLAAAKRVLPDTALFLECVSAAKAVRLAPLLEGAAAVHANVLEAGVLLGRAVGSSLDDALQAARDLVGRGVAAAYVTAGAHGIAYASAEGEGTRTAPGTAVVNATGAGDAFMAGVVAATLDGADAHVCAAFASACAAITLASEETVAGRMSRQAVESLMEEMTW